MIFIKSRITGRVFATILATLFTASSAYAEERTPIEEFRDGFPLELSVRAHAADLATINAGGDEQVYFARRASEFLRTRVLPVRQPTKSLVVSEIPAIGKIEAKPLKMDRMTLDAFIANPQSYLEGIVVVHKGKLVFERYPRMRPEDYHLTFSVAKVMPSLIVDQLIAEGKIDPSKPLSDYIPAFASTPTGKVRVIDAMDMTSGLNTDALFPGRTVDTDSFPISTRLLMSIFGMPVNGKVEKMLYVMKAAKPDPSLKPGEAFRYSSHSTQLLVFLAEAVEGKRWADIFEKRVWSKIHVEAPLQVPFWSDNDQGVKFLISAAAGQKNDQSDQNRNITKCNSFF